MKNIEWSNYSPRVTRDNYDRREAVLTLLQCVSRPLVVMPVCPGVWWCVSVSVCQCVTVLTMAVTAQLSRCGPWCRPHQSPPHGQMWGNYTGTAGSVCPRTVNILLNVRISWAQIRIYFPLIPNTQLYPIPMSSGNNVRTCCTLYVDIYGGAVPGHCLVTGWQCLITILGYTSTSRQPGTACGVINITGSSE